MVEFAPGRVAGDDVQYARQGTLGRIRLNRPRVINALTHPMVRDVHATLDEWACDDSVGVVSIEGTGDRGLCAGGDIRALRAAMVDGVGDPVAFWADEYRLNAAINAYPKPFVAFMDGVVMGGGVGVSTYGSLRLVTERSRVAMPETGIGFFPDVGALFVLSRAPGELGTHLALTGAAVGGADAIAVGYADALVDSASIPSLVGRLAAGERLDGTVGSRPPATLDAEREWVDQCYAGDDPAAILQALRAHAAPGAQAAATLLQSRSPLSVAVTLEAVRRARSMASVEEVFEQDRLLGIAFAHRSDFVEGVRAVLVDRDHAPRWRHPSLEDVSRAEVEQIFGGSRPHLAHPPAPL